MVFTVLIAANIFLTLENRSFYYSVFVTLRYRNNLVWLVIFISLATVGIILTVQPLTDFFGFMPLNFEQIVVCIVIGLLSVIWFEIPKRVGGIKRVAC